MFQEIIVIIDIIASDAERVRKRVYGTSKQSNISEIIDFFFDMVYWTKSLYFWTYIRYPWWTGVDRPDTAVTLFDALFLSQLEWYKI